jgi:hypothetical protein
VVADELNSVPDIQDKHRRVLAGELKITTFRALARADRRDIHRAMRNLRPRPTLEQIARWQDHARSRLSEAAADQSEWHPAASFAVVFVQRQGEDGEWERRIEVERTEVEPEQEGRTWLEWDCREICGWMREQLGLPGTAEPAPGQAGGEEEAGAAAGEQPAAEQPTARRRGAKAARPGDPEPVPVPAAQTRGRGELRIGSVTLIDPGSQLSRLGAATSGAPPVDVITSGAVPAPPAAPEGPLRVEITVGGARRGQEIHAVARVLPRGAPGWNPQDPVVIKGAGAASFDLSRLPEGRHEVALIAWAPDGSMTPAAVRLPELTIQPRQ